MQSLMPTSRMSPTSYTSTPAITIAYPLCKSTGIALSRSKRRKISVPMQEYLWNDVRLKKPTSYVKCIVIDYEKLNIILSGHRSLLLVNRKCDVHDSTSSTNHIAKFNPYTINFDCKIYSSSLSYSILCH